MERFATSYDSRFATNPLYGYAALSYGYEEPPPHAEDGGYSKRLMGDHPPKPPISYKEWSLMQRYNSIKTKYGTPGMLEAAGVPEAIRGNVLQANEAVVKALRDTSSVNGMFSTYRHCLKASRADAGVLDRAGYQGLCGTWASQLEAAERQLADAVGAAEATTTSIKPPLSEAIEAGADETKTTVEQAEAVINDAACDWWCQAKQSSPWVGRLPWIAGGLIASRVLLPPLFATWLDSRKAGELNQW